MSEECCITHGKIKRPGCTRKTGIGVVRAWYACIADILSIPAPVVNTLKITDNITLKEDAVFYEIEVDKTKSSFKITSEGDGETVDYNCTAVLTVAGVDEEVSRITTGFPRSGLLYIIQDKQGNRRLFGELGDGANSKVDEADNPNATTINVIHRSGDVPYYYTGAITVEED